MRSKSVPNYLTQAILVTLLCFPFGIAAIVQAAQVNSKLQAGDYEGAIQSSEKAKKYCWYGFIICLIAVVLLFLFGSGV